MNAQHSSPPTREQPTVTDDPVESGMAGEESTDEPGAPLRHRSRKTWMTRGSATLAALVIVLAGFLGGAYAQQRWGGAAGTSTAGFPNGVASGAPGGFGGLSGSAGSAPNGQATAAGTLTGSVTLVDGDTIYVRTADGRVVTVKVSGSTAVQLAQGGSLAGLSTGSSVTVTGESATDGSVNASAITRTK